MSYMAVWSLAGGAGVTTVASTLGVLAAAHRRAGGLLVDLAGDVPAVFGLHDDDGPGVVEWLRARDCVDLGVYPGRVLEPVPGLAVAPRGRGALAVIGVELLARQLAVDCRDVIVDAGTGPDVVASLLVQRAARSVLVTRTGTLALARLARRTLPVTDLVVVTEPYRTVDLDDIARAAAAPVAATVPWDPAVALAVDGGRFAEGLPGIPRTLRQALTGF